MYAQAPEGAYSRAPEAASYARLQEGEGPGYPRAEAAGPGRGIERTLSAPPAPANEAPVPPPEVGLHGRADVASSAGSRQGMLLDDDDDLEAMAKREMEEDSFRFEALEAPWHKRASPVPPALDREQRAERTGSNTPHKLRSGGQGARRPPAEPVATPRTARPESDADAGYPSGGRTSRASSRPPSGHEPAPRPEPDEAQRRRMLEKRDLLVGCILDDQVPPKQHRSGTPRRRHPARSAPPEGRVVSHPFLGPPRGRQSGSSKTRTDSRSACSLPRLEKAKPSSLPKLGDKQQHLVPRSARSWREKAAGLYA